MPHYTITLLHSTQQPHVADCLLLRLLLVSAEIVIIFSVFLLRREVNVKNFVQREERREKRFFLDDEQRIFLPFFSSHFELIILLDFLTSTRLYFPDIISSLCLLFQLLIDF